MPEWAVAVIVLAVIVVAGVVIALVRVHKRRLRGTEVPISSVTPVPARVDEEPAQTPVECQPVAPADQAEGFGWMKASDLANHQNKP